MLLSLGALIGIIPFIYYLVIFIEKAQNNAPDGYEFPSYRDFKWTLLSCVILSIVDWVANRAFYPLFKPYCKEQNDVAECDRRTKKTTNNIYKFFYYTAITIWGYSVLENKRFFPKLLGGNGDLFDCHLDFPYQNPETRTGVQLFLLGQLGFHLSQLVRMYVV